MLKRFLDAARERPVVFGNLPCTPPFFYSRHTIFTATENNNVENPEENGVHLNPVLGFKPI